MNILKETGYPINSVDILPLLREVETDPYPLKTNKVFIFTTADISGTSGNVLRVPLPSGFKSGRGIRQWYGILSALHQGAVFTVMQHGPAARGRKASALACVQFRISWIDAVFCIYAVGSRRQPQHIRFVNGDAGEPGVLQHGKGNDGDKLRGAQQGNLAPPVKRRTGNGNPAHDRILETFSFRGEEYSVEKFLVVVLWPDRFATGIPVQICLLDSVNCPNPPFRRQGGINAFPEAQDMIDAIGSGAFQLLQLRPVQISAVQNDLRSGRQRGSRTIHSLQHECEIKGMHEEQKMGVNIAFQADHGVDGIKLIFMDTVRLHCKVRFSERAEMAVRGTWKGFNACLAKEHGFSFKASFTKYPPHKTQHVCIGGVRFERQKVEQFVTVWTDAG